MDGDNIRVRAAGTRDAEALWSVHRESIRVLCRKDYSSEQIAAWISGLAPDLYVRSMAEHQEKMWIAEADSGPVGFAGRRRDEITAVYVVPEVTRRHVGSVLLKTLEAGAMQEGVQELWLDASLTAVPFYQGHGYTVVRELSHTLRSGVPIICVRMEKALA